MIKDYDLNIFQSDTADPAKDPWFMDIYEVVDKEHTQLGICVQLTPGEVNKLKLGQGYFSDYDNWYGLDGFITVYEECISPRLWNVFENLPKE